MSNDNSHYNDKEHPPTGPDVTVMINGIEKSIDRGSHAVSELKVLLGVSQDLALSQDINGTLSPLADDARVTVKGGEAFFSGPRTGGSSHA